jgi:hypothetical protein
VVATNIKSWEIDRGPGTKLHVLRYTYAGIDDAGVEDAPYIFNSSEDSRGDDTESMQLDSLFAEDYQGASDEQDNQHLSDPSASAPRGDTALGSSESSQTPNEDATQSPSPNHQNRSETRGQLTEAQEMQTPKAIPSIHPQ